LVFKGQRLSDPLNLRVIPHVDALAWTGVVLCIAGLAFCIWARFTLGRNWSAIDAVIARLEGVVVRECEKGGTAASIKAAMGSGNRPVAPRNEGERRSCPGYCGTRGR